MYFGLRTRIRSTDPPNAILGKQVLKCYTSEDPQTLFQHPREPCSQPQQPHEAHYTHQDYC